jgi:sugar phosphate permease
MSEPSGTRPALQTDSANVSSQSSILPGENATIWTLWLTYGAFYFCRQNLSTAVPGMKLSVAEGGLGLSQEQVGWILASLKIAYGLGQLVNGQLSERVPSRVMLAIGMFGSAALNVLFGFSTGFYFLLFVWAINGYCQSLGWTPCIRVAANWVPIARRGHAIGIIGTGYQITLGLTYVIASQAAELLGWRGALYVPAILLSLAGVFMLVFLREAPGNQRTGSEGDPHPTTKLPQLSFSEGLYWTLYNPTLWLLGLSLGLLNACRYGFLDWGVTHLMESRKVAVDKAGLQFFVIAIGAVAGSYLAGWATDRWFGGRRGPVICVLMAILGCLSLVYDTVVQSSVIGSMILLVVIGFCIYGPQVLLVGTAPADLAHRGTSAAAAGFVNFMGYLGAATGDVVTGYYSASEHGGWQTAIYIWAGWAFGGAAIMAVLWNATTGKVGLVPAIVPKLFAFASLGLAGAAAGWAGEPVALRVAAIAAAGCLIGTLITRWAAVPALAVAAASLVYVFTSYIQGTSAVSWQLNVAAVSYGLAMISTVMILVEREGQLCESS